MSVWEIVFIILSVLANAPVALASALVVLVTDLGYWTLYAIGWALCLVIWAAK